MTTTAHERSVRARFSSAAGTYENYATVQNLAAQRLISMIGSGAAPDRILEAGCGSGQLTRLLLETFPGADIEAIDLAPDMIARGRQNLADHPRVRWIIGDIKTYRSDRTCSLIASSSALQWVIPLEEGIGNLRAMLDPGGRLVCALMIHGTLRELHEARLRVAPAKPPRGQLPAGPAVRAILEQQGFGVASWAEEDCPVSYHSARHLLQRLHQSGVTGGQVSQSAVPLNRGELKRLAEYYQERYSDGNGSVRATYRLCFFIAVRHP